MKYYVYTLMNQYGAVEYVGQTYNTDKRMQAHTKFNDGKFYGRTDLTLELVKEFDNRRDAMKYEGELKLALNMEWTEKTGAIKGGTIGGRKGGLIGGRKHIESGHIQKLGRKAVESGRLKMIGKVAAENASLCLSAYRKDGTYIGTYPSQAECARQLGINTTHIAACFNGRLKSIHGYTFKRELK